MTTPSVRLEGHGIAAAAFAALRGGDISWKQSIPSGERFVALDPQTVKLLDSIFDLKVASVTPSRWTTRRAVAWNSRSFEIMNAPALICDIAALARALTPCATDTAEDSTDWTVDCVADSPKRVALFEGGRKAATAFMTRPTNFDIDCAYIAATPVGWLYAAARSDDEIVLTGVFAMGQGDVGACFQQSVRHLWPTAARNILTVSHPIAVPRFAVSTEPNRLLVGDSALAVDPIRGDGVGYAVRGAILASAVLDGAASMSETDRWRDHYRNRLANVARQHILNCVEYYKSSWNSSIWEAEIAEMQAWAADNPENEIEFHLNMI